MLAQNKVDAFTEFAKAFAPCNDVQRGYIMGCADAMKMLIDLNSANSNKADHKQSA